MREKIKEGKKKEWFCPNCNKFTNTPNPASFSIFGPIAEMSCDTCGSWVLELTERREEK